jgi:hypothetical protein
MQTYNYKFDPTTNNNSMAVQVSADLFVYESGRATVDNVSPAVLVKPDNGAEIVLRPGQRFRLAPGSTAQTWNVRPVDPAAVIQAAFVIGSGEFDDANTLNKFTFDTGSGALPMLIKNTTADRVPVVLDPALNTIPLMAYTTARNTNIAAGVYNQVLVTAAENLNGLVIEQMTAMAATVDIYAHPSPPPANAGFNAAAAYLNNVPAVYGKFERTRIKVPAGHAVWAVNAQGGANEVRSLFTFL